MRPYRHGDFDEIDAREDFAREHAAMGWPLRRERPPGCAWTITRAGAPMGCGGITYNKDRSAWVAWCYLAKFSRGEWGYALRCARKALAFIDREGGAVVEATALWEHQAAVRTLERLGFAFEAGDFTYDDRAYVRLARRA